MFIQTNITIDNYRRNPLLYHGGADAGEVPPVLIPNTEVKLSRVNGTSLETNWKSRKVPSFMKR